MGEMRDSDWSRQILLRSDWLPPSVAPYTTDEGVESDLGGDHAITAITAIKLAIKSYFS